MTIELKDEEIKDTKVKKEQNEIPLDKKKQSHWKYILFVILFAVIGVGIYYGTKIYRMSKDIGFKLDANTVFTDAKPELKKDPTGNFTNALIIGVDTRENGNYANTDTMIFLSYNHTTHNIVMISVPRDFLVETDKTTHWYNKINGVYSYNESLKQGSGLEALKTTIEEVVGQQIQYYAMVDFKAFTQIIDAVGGIDVNVENSFTDYYYLDSTTVSFTAGPQTMDGETALKYARSRKSLDNGEGTDYARARRQQKVISALQEKIISTDTLANPKTLIQILSSISDSIKVSEFTQDDIIAALTIGKDMLQNGNKHYSFVLDPASGNSQLIEVKGDPNVEYTIGPKLGLGKYDDIHEYVNLVLTKPAIYAENPIVYVYNTGLGASGTTLKVNQLKKEYPYINILQSYANIGTYSGVTIFSTTEGFSESVKELSTFLNTQNTIKPETITTKFNYEGVAILFGEENETQLSEVE
ncbi:MAG TPA: LCP family protein [Candidatus Dojkabacteria bacterium]|nr:LCP family protein [Candidatus Dojkabacteria bacterium]